MKKAWPLIIVFSVFITSLLYLHQKILIYVEAYRLSSNQQRYNELVDKRDYLMYNFAKEISLTKVNQWAKNECFVPVGRERFLASGILPSEPFQDKTVVSLLNRFLKTSVATSTVLAEDSR